MLDIRMKPFKSITDPDSIELLGDETRRRIIHLLRAREMPISQVAEELKITPQAIYHHVKKLLKAGMVEVGSEERIENFIERYYRASAEVLQVSWGTQGKNKDIVKQRLHEQLAALGKIGIKVEVKSETVTRLIKIQEELERLHEMPRTSAKISKLEGVDFVGKQQLDALAKAISMSDRQFQNWLVLQEEFRRLLRSLLRTRLKRQRR